MLPTMSLPSPENGESAPRTPRKRQPVLQVSKFPPALEICVRELYAHPTAWRWASLVWVALIIDSNRVPGLRSWILETGERIDIDPDPAKLHGILDEFIAKLQELRDHPPKH